ncbi:ATP-binding protein [Ohtaekwangia kribbensis]|uniref:histidine kinase n=1 Tax=Ohtaekwangia kribbensis TaxID=688913 RepID=A0ABW3KD90_9BACT
MVYRFVLIGLVMVSAMVSHAQVSYSLGNEGAYIARMQREMAQSGNDSVQAYACLKLSLLYKRTNDTTQARHFLEKGVAAGKQYTFIEAASVYYRAIVHYAPRDINNLEKYILKSDSMLARFSYPEAYRLRSMIYSNYGIIQQVKGNEKGAMDAFTTAATFASKVEDFLLQGKAYKSMAIVFMNANRRDKASSYLEQAIQVLEKLSPDNPLNLVELIESYSIAGENYIYQEEYDVARRAIDAARNALQPYPASNLYVGFYYTEGLYYDKQKKHVRAIESFDKGIEFAGRVGAAHAQNRLTYAKYKALANLKEYRKAIVVLEDLLKSPLVFLQDKKLYYKELYSCYTRLGNEEKALYWADQYIVLSDSLYEIKFQKDIVELETRYKNAENEKKIATLQAETEKATLASRNTRLINWMLILISIFLGITVVFAIILYRNSKRLTQQMALHYQQQIKDGEQKQQIQVARALMQGEEQERKRLAIDLHDGLGGRLAAIKTRLSHIASNRSNGNVHDLHSLQEQLDISSNELRRIARNMMPESLLQLGLEPALKDMCESMTSATTQITFEAFGLDNALPQEKQVNIYRMVQELLTNAIRHAEASEILVQCSQNESVFFITVEDNGKGFTETNNAPRPGIGLGNVRTRVEYLNGKLDIASAEGEGTTINIEFDVTR